MLNFFTPSLPSRLHSSTKSMHIMGKRNLAAASIKLHVSTELLHTFHPQIEHLRKVSAPKNDTIPVDHIDGKSSHFVLYHNSKMVGSVRISSSQDSILKLWYNQQYPYPIGPGIAELTKAVILPTYQCNGLYKLMMLEVLLRLPLLGYSMVNASVRPTLLQRPFLRELGFVEHNKTLLLRDAQANFEAIPICLKYIDAALVKEKYLAHTERLNQKNIIINSDLTSILPIISRKIFHI